jgi:hypothetical protein
MCKLWAARAAIVVCLAFGGLPTLAQSEGSGRLTLEVRDLVGMEDLELVAQIGTSPQPTSVGWADPSFHVLVDASPFTSTLGTFLVSSGPYVLVVFAGPPPCRVAFVPNCQDSEPPYQCWVRFDIPAGEAITMTIDGLPATMSQTPGSPNVGCPVAELFHADVAPALE